MHVAVRASPTRLPKPLTELRTLQATLELAIAPTQPNWCASVSGWNVETDWRRGVALNRRSRHPTRKRGASSAAHERRGECESATAGHAEGHRCRRCAGPDGLSFTAPCLRCW